MEIALNEEQYKERVEIEELRRHNFEMQKVLIAATDLVLDNANKKDLPGLQNFLFYLKMFNRSKTNQGSNSFLLNKQIEAVITLHPGHSNIGRTYF
ncbi:MAG: hypothetical protein ACTHJN_19280 [Ginsengibacter sp.]